MYTGRAKKLDAHFFIMYKSQLQVDPDLNMSPETTKQRKEQGQYFKARTPLWDRVTHDIIHVTGKWVCRVKASAQRRGWHGVGGTRR